MEDSHTEVLPLKKKIIKAVTFQAQNVTGLKGGHFTKYHVLAQDNWSKNVPTCLKLLPLTRF